MASEILGRSRRIEREEEIARVALELSLRSGCAGIRVDDIARSLSMSKATLYRLFPGKDDLLRVAFEPGFKDLLAETRTAGSPAEALRCAARRLLGSDGRPRVCCLQLVECPYERWDEMDQTLESFLPDADTTPGSGRVLRGLAALLLVHSKRAGRALDESDVERLATHLENR